MTTRIKSIVLNSDPVIGKIEPGPEIAAALGTLKRPCACARVNTFFHGFTEGPEICDRCREAIDEQNKDS